MNVMVSIAFIYAVVTIHELGHYYAAKCTGVHVLDTTTFKWYQMVADDARFEERHLTDRQTGNKRSSYQPDVWRTQ